MKLILRLIGLAGIAIFGLALALTWLSPIQVERAARGFIQSEIERELAERISEAGAGALESRIGRLTKGLAERHEAEIAGLRERMARGLNAEIASTVARMQDPSCACRRLLLERLDSATEARLAALERAGPRLRRVIEGKYSEIVAELLRDLRIFAGSNLLAFLVLVILSFSRPDRVRQLFVPALLLVAAAIAASAVYLLGQNWFFTLIHGDFVGLAYTGWLLLIFGLLCDVALFKAKVTTLIVDVVFSALGKAVPAC
jgi:hypothetical protein